MKIIKNKATMLLAGLACMMLSVGASASPITLSGKGWTQATPGSGQTGSVTGGGRTVTAIVGQFRFSGVSSPTGHFAGPLDAFCIDISVNLQTPYVYNVIDASGHAPISGKLNQIALLFETYYHTLGTSADRSAAFQLALWSIVYKDTTTPFSYTAGHFNGAVTTFFGEFTSLTGTAKGLYDLFVLVPVGTNQTLLTVRPVPEPGSLMLLGLGVLGAGAARRFRKH